MPQLVPSAIAFLLFLVAIDSGCSGNTPASGNMDGAVPDAGQSGVTAVLNQDYPPQLLSLLSQAQENVRLIHLYINPDSNGDEVVRHLGEAAKRGVDVYVQLEDSVDSAPSRVQELIALGVQAKVDSSKIFSHAKLVVTDGSRALLGSTNISASSMTKNNEANLLVSDPELAAYFDEYAEGLWLDADSRPKPTAVDNAAGVALSDGSYMAHAEEMVTEAKQRVTLVVYGMNIDDRYPDSDIHKMVGHLAQAVERGVSVRVILEQADYDASVNDLNKDAAKKLKAAGIDVRADALGQITHAKVLIVDDEAIVGSNNWGYGGFTLYHEVGVRTKADNVVQQLISYLDGIWEAASPF